MSNRRIKGLVFGVIGSLALPVWLLAGSVEADARLKSAAQGKLGGARLGADVFVGVEDGVATLTGTVASAGLRERAAKEVAKVDGISGVDNRIVVSALTGGDAEILDRAAREVRKYAYYSIFDDVMLAADNGRLTVTGAVLQPWRKDELGRILALVPGVTAVDNRLEVLPLSSFDNELRLRVARAIYANPMLSRYGLQVNPPIHIVVRDGNVVLTGVVNSEAEKNVAGIEARSAGLSFGLENRLRVETKVASAKP